MSRQRLDEFDNLVADFFRPDASAQVRRSQLQAAGILCIQGLSHGRLDQLRLLLETERVAQEQSGAEDRADGIGDPFSRDVRG